MSTSEDEDGNKKTGYELTDYMEEFNRNTVDDYTQGYDPKSLDQDYKQSALMDTKNTTFPKYLDKSKRRDLHIPEETL